MQDRPASRLDQHFVGGADEGGTSLEVDDHEAAQALPQRPQSRNPGRNAGQEESMDGRPDTTPGGRYGPGFPWPGGGESGVASGNFRPLTSAGR